MAPRKRLRLPLLRYLTTVRYLRPRQIAYLIINRLWRHGTRYDRPVNAARAAGFKLPSRISRASSALAGETFTFLNVAKVFPGGAIDWASKDMTRLWRYNLHYFDYLLANDVSGDYAGSVISDWIRTNPPGTGEGWEPYTVSLRIVNWIKFFTGSTWKGDVPQAWLDSLYRQTLWLERHIEYHLLANHYLKNGKALLFAGSFFDSEDATRWFRKGLDIVAKEADEQLLADGGHYERSIMYHSIVLEDYLDVISILSANDSDRMAEISAHLRTKIRTALDFLADLSMPDGQICLFNDAAFGIAPGPKELFDYAEKVIAYRRLEPPRGMVLISRPDTGYYVLGCNRDRMVVDCGPIGPDYQPGHAHCDTLSYELTIDGRRVVVDTGVHDYESGTSRWYARSTKAHNTVLVDGEEQSEIWGVFRVAQRARPIFARLSSTAQNSAQFDGAHDGYRRLRGDVIHRRTIRFHVENGWEIKDSLHGSGEHLLDNFIHLHPEISVRRERNKFFLTASDNALVAAIEVGDDEAVSLEKGWYFPEFGVRLNQVVIKITKSGLLPFQTRYKIRKMPGDRAGNET
ncbi:MAG: heparinase II/III family protein [Acidiferrobacterales bacterium]